MNDDPPRARDLRRPHPGRKTRMVVLAQTPPPFHGQSIMVERLVRLLQSDRFTARLEVEHVNLRLSESLTEIGGFSARKITATFGYLRQLIRIRRDRGIDLLYYVPATALRSQLYRDWVLLGLGRRLAGKTILHWHGLGLREFYEKSLRPLERILTGWTYDRHDVSLVLTPAHQSEVGWLHPGTVAVAPNFLSDPCRDTAAEIIRRREERAGQRAARASDAPDLELLFLGHCTRGKGLFDAIEAVTLANSELEMSGVTWRVRLSVGGEFMEAGEREEFERRISLTALALKEGQSAVRYLGYLGSAQKAEALASHDGFCLPTYFHTEAQPLSVIEAAAYGLEIVISDWRSLPSMIPSTPFVVPPRSPELLAKAILACAVSKTGARNREHFLLTYDETVVADQLLKVLTELVCS